MNRKASLFAGWRQMLAFWSGSAMVAIGVALHLPMFGMARKMGFRLVGMLMDTGMLGKLFRILARYSPPGTQVDLPVSWGDEAVLKERLGAYVVDLRIKREVVRFRSLSPSHWVEFMRTYFGPAIRAFQHSPSEAQQALTNEMTELMREHNRASNGTALGESEYLDVVATRR